MFLMESLLQFFKSHGITDIYFVTLNHFDASRSRLMHQYVSWSVMVIIMVQSFLYKELFLCVQLFIMYLPTCRAYCNKLQQI